MKSRILVYDCSLFGRTLGKFLEQELGVGVEAVVDFSRLQEMSDREICRHVAEKIRPYMAEKAGIVIASPLVVAVVAGELEKIFPKKKFVYYGRGALDKINVEERVTILTLERIRRTERYQTLKAGWQGAEIDEPNCGEWLGLMDQGWWGGKKIAKNFEHKLGMKVMIYHQAFLLREKEVKEIVDWRGELVDVKREIVAPVREIIRLDNRRIKRREMMAEQRMIAARKARKARRMNSRVAEQRVEELAEVLD